MKNIGISVILALCLPLATTAAFAESIKQAQPEKIQPNTVSSAKTVSTNTTQTPICRDSKQGYRLVTDALDSFSGKSESPNYTIKLTSGGQSSPISASASATFVIRAGFVHSSYVKRGDPNADGIINLGDAIYTLNYLFKGGPNPCPMEAGDANCTGVVDLGDAIYILNYLFKGGPAPVC